MGATFREVFSAVAAGRPPSGEELSAVFAALLAGEWTGAQIAGLLVALRLGGETAEQLTAAARALRERMVPLPHRLPRVLDTCGTGGDGLETVNLSTGAALIAAAAGVPVAKHGNRAVSSRAGSADVLEALGIPLDLSPERAAAVLEETHITFLMAPRYHPALRQVAEVRRELGVRTLFNGLGPLANPAGATHQLVGAYEDRLRPLLAAALRDLGTRRAWVVRGADGLDEVSPYGATRVTALSEGALTELEVTPEEFGFRRSAAGTASGGDAATNAAILEAVLRGERVPAREAFLLNGAAALVVADGLTLREAGERATALVDSGAALRTLAAWRRATTDTPLPRAEANATPGPTQEPAEPGARRR